MRELYWFLAFAGLITIGFSAAEIRAKPDSRFVGNEPYRLTKVELLALETALIYSASAPSSQALPRCRGEDDAVVCRLLLPLSADPTAAERLEGLLRESFSEAKRARGFGWARLEVERVSLEAGLAAPALTSSLR